MTVEYFDIFNLCAYQLCRNYKMNARKRAKQLSFIVSTGEQKPDSDVCHVKHAQTQTNNSENEYR